MRQEHVLEQEHMQTNFTQDELIEAIERAHIYGKKFYLTVNTLLKDHEIAELYDYLAPLYEKGLGGSDRSGYGCIPIYQKQFSGS